MNKPGRSWKSALAHPFGCLALLLSALLSSAQGGDAFRFSKLPALPDAEGLAGPFAGLHNGMMLVAGGANFPERKPWEGGKKVWHDTIFLLDKPNGQWRRIQNLPRPLGYGTSLSTSNGVACLGGSDSQAHYPESFLLQYTNGHLRVASLPRLPRPCANSCGALIGNTLYVAGGTERPDSIEAMRTFWSLDLSTTNHNWRELEPWPGRGRMLATAGASEGSFFLFGGASLVVGKDGGTRREWLRDAYRYTPNQGWKRIADLPRVSVAAPTPAPVFGTASLLIVGGDDGAQVNTQPQSHRGFRQDVLAYDARSDSWSTLGEAPFALVTTPAVNWAGRIIIPGGETRPGIRSTEVWAITERTPP